MLIGIDASRAARHTKTGVEWYSHHLLKELLSMPTQHQYRLYTQAPLDFSLPPYAQERTLAWPMPFLWTQGGLSFEMLWHSPDILFVPSHAMPFIHARRTITTVHDIGFRRFPELVPPKQLNYLRWSTRFACRNASRIITISEFSKQEICAAYKVPEERISVTHLGYDSERYIPGDSASAQAQLHTSLGLARPFILFVGRLEQRKNISYILDVFERVHEKYPDLELVFAGIDGYGASEFRQRCARSTAGRAIRLLGWVNEDTKILLYQAAFCFFFPSLYEGFGIPIIEAQACGTPVICSNTTSLPEVAADGAICIDPTVIDQSVDAIVQITADVDLRESLCKKGQENCEKFSWKKTAEETKKILEET